jgi:PAS domain S-box-containing protein
MDENYTENIDVYKLLETLPNKEYDAITELASVICNVPFASIFIHSDKQQFYKSCFGYNVISDFTNQSLCSFAINQPNQIFTVENINKDNRFKNKSYVINESKIVFYTGVQLITSSNDVIGVLAVYDFVSRSLTDVQINSLQLLANQVVQLIELHKSKIELDQSENKYKSMIENSIIPILFSNPITERVIDANKAACELFGYSVEEFKTLPREKFIVHDNYAPELLKKRKDFGITGIELTGIKKNGEHFALEASSSIFKNNTNEVRSISFITDISKRKKIESENIKLMNNSEVLFVMTDSDFKIISFNKQFQKLYKYYFGVDIMIGGSFFEYAHPLDRDKEIEICNRVINGSNEENEFTIVKDDIKTSFLLKYHPTKDENMNVNGIFVAAFDITKRKNAERLLVKREKELSLIYNNVNDAIFLFENEGDNKFRMVSINNSYLKISGFKEDKVIGQYIDSFIPEPKLNLVLKYIQLAISTKDMVTWEEERNYITGLKMIITTITPIFNSKGICTQLIGTFHDVTEERIALNEREKISNELNKIMHSSLDVICTIDEFGNFVTVSNASEKVWGYLPEELAGKPFIDLVVEEDRERTLKTAGELMNGAEYTDFENSYIKKNGSIVPIIWSIKWDAKDRIIYCTAKDASEKQRHEEELILSEKKYKYLFENNPAPMFIWDFETFMMVDCNAEALLKYGYTKEEFLQLNIKQIRPPEEMAAFNNLKVNEEEIGKVILFTTKHLKKSGEIMNVKVNAHIMEYNGRKSSLVLINDITEKTRIQQEIIASEKKYKHLFENNPAPMYIFDIESLVIVDCNDEMLLKYGYSREEFLQMSMLDIRPSEEINHIKDRIQEEHKKVSKVIKLTTKHQKKNGEIIIVNINVHVMNYNGRKSALVLIDDVTEKLKYLQSIEKQNEILKEIAWMQSHVVRAPLARIMGFVDLINESKKIEDKIEMLPFVLDSAKELDIIVKEIVNKSVLLSKQS